MGRPTIDGVVRSTLVLIRITPQEKAAWRRKAKAAGMKLGPWIAKPRRDELKAERGA